MEFLSFVVELILQSYWSIVESFAEIGNCFDVVNEATWLVELSGNLKSLVTAKLMPAFSGVGLAIAVTYFLISIIGLVTEDRFTPEFLVKFFAKLVISIAVVLWSDTILIAITDFGDAMGNMFTDWTVNDFLNANTNVKEEFNTFADGFLNSVCFEYMIDVNGAYPNYTLEDVNGIGIIAALGASLVLMPNGILLLLIAYLVMPIIMAVVYFIEISRLIEFYIRGSFLPIVAGVMADDGWRGAGGRYIKKLLALATQKMVISMTCAMTGAMTTNYLIDRLQTSAEMGALEFMAESFPMIITAIVICLAGISFMFKSLQVVNDLWGAN